MKRIATLPVTIATIVFLCSCVLAAGPPGTVKADRPTLDRGSLDCTNALPLACGDVVAGSNVGMFNDVEVYDCSVYWALSGPEVVYELTLDEFQVVDIHLGDNACDLALILLASCEEDDCLGSSDGFYEEHITATLPSGTYYVVVEGYDGAECSYTLSVACTDVQGDCGMEMLEASCERTTSGDTCGASHHGPAWGDCGYASGNDHWYPVTVAPGSQFQARTVFGGLGTGMAVVWIAESCLRPYGCLDFQQAAPGSYGTDYVTYHNATPEEKEVYIVVDTATSLACSYYSLIMNCSGSVVRDEAMSWGEVKSLYK